MLRLKACMQLATILAALMIPSDIFKKLIISADCSAADYTLKEKIPFIQKIPRNFLSFLLNNVWISRGERKLKDWGPVLEILKINIVLKILNHPLNNGFNNYAHMRQSHVFHKSQQPVLCACMQTALYFKKKKLKILYRHSVSWR